MGLAPNLDYRDGSGTTNSLVFTTNQEFITLTGTVSPDTVGVQLSINGSAWSQDLDYIAITNETFTIPNLEVYPTGLPLGVGVNTISIRTIDLIGAISSSSTATITRTDNSVVPGSQIPTGIRVARLRDRIELWVAVPQPTKSIQQDEAGDWILSVVDPAEWKGFNFYGSTEPNGATGYYRLNAKTITTPTRIDQQDIQTLEDVAVWDLGTARNLHVRIVEEDQFGNELNVRFDGIRDLATLGDTVEWTGSLRNYAQIESVVWTHIRNGGSDYVNTDQFRTLPDSDPIYYRVTGVYWDPITSTEIETPFSQEVLGQPIVIDTSIRDLPGRDRTAIVLDYCTQVLRQNADISIIPGSITRDIDIDPFSSEAERMWFLMDFIHRSQSVSTLLAVDNVNGSGTSDDVQSSAYKVALKAAIGYQQDSSVQSLIDQQFDKLATNSEITRQAGRKAVGELVLYTVNRPTKDLIVPANSIAISTSDTGSVRYIIAGSYTLPSGTAEAYYNFNARRYEITVSIIAESSGANGNVPPNSIKTLVGVSGLSCINDVSIVYGADRESNAELANRILLRYSSVDTGTLWGYYRKTIEKVGVLKTKVIQSGDPIMMRDWDDVRSKHIGGKVDVWIQGVQERLVSDVFAFSVDLLVGVFTSVLDSTNLILRVEDTRLTVTTPIVEVVGVRNTTTGQDFDINGVQILDYNRVQLSTAISQPVLTVDHTVTVEVRYRSDNHFVPTVQPVRRIVSVTGGSSGVLTQGTHYRLYKPQDPLLEGESRLAGNYIAVVPVDGIPSGATLIVNDELHVLIGVEPEPLGSIGINLTTIRVFSEDRTIEYTAPWNADSDFELIDGTNTQPAKILRTSGSRIASGQEISVDYQHDENFTVQYVVNQTLQQVQDILEQSRHVTADVVVKQAVENLIDIETTVQLKSGATKDRVDPLIRNRVSLEFYKKQSGESLAISNIVACIDDADGVQFCVEPLAKMCYRDGSLRIRESVLSTAQPIEDLSTVGKVYLLVNPLQYPTVDSGGDGDVHKGVFSDDVQLTPSTSLELVGSAVGQQWIVGRNGAIIPGYSDDQTLLDSGISQEDVESTRAGMTANRVLVSCGILPDHPSQHVYTVSYNVYGDIGPHDIETLGMENLQLGTLTITYGS